MMTKTKESGALNHELMELHQKCIDVLREKLPKLGYDDQNLLRKIGSISWVNGKENEVEKIYDETDNSQDRLNQAFAKREGIPPTVDRKETLGYLSEYIKAHFGKEMKLSVIDLGEKYFEGCVTNYKNAIAFDKNCDTLEAIEAVHHIMSLIENRFSKEFVEVSARVFPAFERLHDEQGIIDFYAKLTGAKVEDIRGIWTEQQEGYGHFDPLAFLMLLYERGVYKPDEITKQELKNLKFVSYPFIRRAFDRFRRGKDAYAMLELLEGDDEILNACVAFSFERMIGAQPRATLKSREMKENHQERMSTFRVTEGWEGYYTWQMRLGEKAMQNLEKTCRESGMLPGLSEDLQLVVIDPGKPGMWTADTEKLKAGITNIENLKKEEVKNPPWFPK